MKTKKTLALPVMAATVALALGGCVAVDNTPVSAPKTETTAPVNNNSTPAEDEVEEQPVDDEAEPSDGGSEVTEAPEPSDRGGESEDESPAPERSEERRVGKEGREGETTEEWTTNKRDNKRHE